jgi:hypothetical protein
MNNPLLILVWIIFGLSILTTNISNNFAMAASNGGAFVVQEQVSTGNLNLDKEINKFYHCISKTHADPPSIQSVDNCYHQTSIGDHQTSTGGTSDDGGNRNIQYQTSTGGTSDDGGNRNIQYQTSTGGTSDDGGNRTHYNNDETHSSTVGILRVVPPPGVLVEANQPP